MTPLQERFKEAIEKQDLTITHELDGIHITKLSPVEIHAAAIACEKIADEFAEKFYTWCIDKVHFIDSDGLNVMTETSERITHKQLLQQFKEERK